MSWLRQCLWWSVCMLVPLSKLNAQASIPPPIPLGFQPGQKKNHGPRGPKNQVSKEPRYSCKKVNNGPLFVIKQNNKNPFVLVEAMPLVECLHAWPFEQAKRPSLQPPTNPSGISTRTKEKPRFFEPQKTGCAYLRDPRDLREIIIPARNN